jgi:DNA-binding HxlR family transcriptional regulator
MAARIPPGTRRNTETYDESPPRVEHELTPLGRTPREPVAATRDWAEVRLPEILAALERADGQADDDRGR